MENPNRGSAEHAESIENATASNSDVCFVISPFGGWFDQYYDAIFIPAIEAAGLKPRRADDLFMSSDIVRDIWGLVTTCKVMVADLTGKNPNVFYELGLAHAAGKPVLLLTQSMQDVPFDLRSLRVAVYDVNHPAWSQLLQEKIKNGLREAISAPQRWVLPTFLLEHPQQQPSVSKDEKRLLELQQEINALRAEVQSLRPSFQSGVYAYSGSTGYTPVATADAFAWGPVTNVTAFDSASLMSEPALAKKPSKEEAEAMIAEGVRNGIPSRSTIDTLRRYGHDEVWIRTQIKRISAMPAPQRDKAYPPKE